MKVVKDLSTLLRQRRMRRGTLLHRSSRFSWLMVDCRSRGVGGAFYIAPFSTGASALGMDAVERSSETGFEDCCNRFFVAFRVSEVLGFAR
jgi:hypothetical protein